MTRIPDSDLAAIEARCAAATENYNERGLCTDGTWADGVFVATWRTDLPRLAEALREAYAIIDRLPTDHEDNPIAPGDEKWTRDGKKVIVEAVHPRNCCDDSPLVGYADPIEDGDDMWEEEASELFPTPESAEAAAAAARMVGTKWGSCPECNGDVVWTGIEKVACTNPKCKMYESAAELARERGEE